MGVRLQSIGDRSGHSKIDVLIYVYMEVIMIYFLNKGGIDVYMKVIMIYFLHTNGINDYIKEILI